ncbi:uncharacterized protein PHALS_09261 [Plasmopara halstedii]|uniref:Uncharacterized protein n=1 Tax=Plasmopara halstedii TaxID=4781 RepID=A0A0P1AFD4_PLAHL|nr:uncharacterized protein PHALS_09261 [Plasmopara halstedii]CEG39207.1 hypothetical protein PHALS_09261 [Plasmopara halstedii]|eukprot:XP_024575576.1 hypothetical protein PHALS_09261 [Plasmopara halstedii]
MLDSVATTRVGNDAEGSYLAVSSLSESLRARLNETMQLLVSLEQELEKSDLTMDIYQKCCRHLIAYMASHMNTSEKFVEKMEKVIEASYSSCQEIELRSSVSGNLWVQYNGGGIMEPEPQSAVVPSTPSLSNPIIKTDTETGGAVVVTPLTIMNASGTGMRQSCSPHVDLTVTTSPPTGQSSKRHLQRLKEPYISSKRARQTVARKLYDAGTSDRDKKKKDSESENANECEVEIVTVESEVHDCVQSLQKRERNGEIEWVCDVDSPSKQSVAYQKRLKAALKLVDALNCCPPVGMVCFQGCWHLRGRMCETHRTLGGGAMPCHDGSCRVWLEIDKHLVRCQNSQCDFKNMVGLRQTKYDIQQHQIKLEATRQKLFVVKNAMATSGSHGIGSPIRCNNQLKNKIERLKEKCTKLEDIIVLHKDRERAFAVDLNALRTRAFFDGFEFQRHYVRNKCEQ